MLIAEISELRTKLIDKIRSYAAENDLKAYRLAQLAGLSETSTRDFETSSWNPQLETLGAIEEIIPKGWAPTGRHPSQTKGPLRSSDLPSNRLHDGTAGRLSRAFGILQASQFILTDATRNALIDGGVMEFATLVRRHQDGRFLIEDQGKNVQIFGRRFKAIGTDVEEKPDRAYGRFVGDRIRRCWATSMPILQHISGRVKGGRVIDSWSLLVPLRASGERETDLVLSVALPVWERRDLAIE